MGAGTDAPEERCHVCAAPLDVQQLPWWRQAWWWFTSGRPVSRVERRCPTCGLRSWGPERTGGRLTFSTPRASRLRRPLEVLQVLHRRRLAHPTPIVYAEAALVGLAAGLVARVLGARRWWLGPPWAMATAWTAFAATGFRRSHPRPASEDLLQVASPARAQRLAAERRAALLRQPPFPLYEVVGWEGRRCLDGVDHSDGQPTEVRLAFTAAQRAADGAVVRIGTHRGPEGVLAERLAEELAARTDAAHGSEDRVAHPPRWTGVRIPVDRRPVAFRVQRADDAWVAYAVRGDHAIAITADPADGLGPEAVALQTVADVGPYLPRG